MASHGRPQQPRRSLKQALKDLFHGRTKKAFQQSQASQPVGSGILRRGGPTLGSTSLALHSQQSLFSGFSESCVSVEQSIVSHAIPNRFSSHQQIQSSTSRPHHGTLLPARSLSQFELHNSYLRTSTVAYHQVQHNLAEVLESHDPYQASVSELTSLSAFSSLSTLKVQDSRRQLRQGATLHPVQSPSPHPDTSYSYRASETRPTLSHPQSGRAPVEPKHVSWLKSPSASGTSVAYSSTTSSSSSASISRSTSTAPASLAGSMGGGPLVEHFKLFCILDTMTPGYPVVMASEQLRYIFNIGEQFFLNNRECEETSMDIVTGVDAAGEPVTHLVLFTPLVIPSSGRHKFLMACLIDVTRFINDAASLPDLDDSSYPSSMAETGPRTPSQQYHSVSSWMAGGYKLSSEDLLGGCVLPEDQKSSSRPWTVSRDDVWLNLACEERSRTSPSTESPQRTRRPALQEGMATHSSHSTGASTSIDGVLEEFMLGLQELYSDFFLLGKSPLSETYYEICNISPTLYTAQDYIQGHLSHTDPYTMDELGTRLGLDLAFSLKVKWGKAGEPKQLYCSPLYGQRSVAWVCFLVDAASPPLW
ncbi:hypothetical protein PV10_01170 [Exophiala mesophila]|uniref:Uncharacterized protein n=1 Tax=Exophiala mesophila TaxID=212818 RepID=A0A0D1X6G0_EXOME|nr:uncharacterized protein PV10_01170 [Exophiala mesophila]KIV97415.1 hypothetical protein PV10_01170 [Exophiala mesophila]